MADAKTIAPAAADGGEASPRPAVDLATVVGLACGLGLIAIAIVVGGSPRAFVNGPSLLIVLGGTFSAVTICFSLADVVASLRLASQAVFLSVRDSRDAALHVLELADTARRFGVLRLQRSLPELARHPFLHKGVSLAVDGMSGTAVEAIMTQDLQATAARHAAGADVLRKAAEYAPAMGLIGTLIGLVQMLANLDDPSSIGPSMAVALITTLYGAILANLVFSPLAAKLDRNAAEETLVHQIYLLAAVSISRQENPRRLELLINSVLPPARRVQYFD